MDNTVIILIAAIGGLLVGYGIRALFSRFQADSIEKQAAAKLEATEAEAERRLREADIQARSEVVQAKEAFEQSTKIRRAALQEHDDRLSAREEDLERRLHVLEEKGRTVQQLLEEQQVRKGELDAREETQSQREAVLTARAQKLAGMTAEEARSLLRNKVKEAVKAECGAYYRRRYEEAKKEADQKAAEVVSYAIRRYTAGHTMEIMTSTLVVPVGDTKARIVGRDGRNLRAFEAATGVTVMVDEAPDKVILSCFNTLRREVALNALKSLIADGRFTPPLIEAMVEKAKQEMEDNCFKLGKEMVDSFGLEAVSTEILTALGKMQFRTSYAQNGLEHSVEVAKLMGTMADELGLDGKLARRIGLFHDIGKVLTDEKEGSHAKLGAEMLQRCGEDRILVEAVAAHHEEVEPTSVYAALCSAADAISSSRPGARNDTVELYRGRIGKLERIAKERRGVLDAYAVQAGHELRVLIDAESFSENEMSILAHDVCGDIEAQLTYPGLIRVVVIREQRCVSYAR